MLNRIKDFFIYIKEPDSLLNAIASTILFLSVAIGAFFTLIHLVFTYSAWALLSVPVAALLWLIFSYWYNQ